MRATKGAVLGWVVVAGLLVAWPGWGQPVEHTLTLEADAPPVAAEAPASAWPKPEQVTVGVYLNDIQSIDLKTHTYAVDAYFWFRWHNPDLDPASTLEFINPSDQWGHTARLGYEKPVQLPTGEWYQTTRIQGRFSKKLPLFNYPFDRQTLDIAFEDSLSEAHDLVYVLGEDPIAINPHLILPGYDIGQPRVRVSQESYPTNFGDLRAPEPGLYARVRVELPVTRPVLAYSAKLLLPVLCVIICAMLMFLFAPRYVDARVGVGITALLTIVALQMTYNQDLPDVGYLMLMDKIYICSYLYVIVGLAAVVRTTRMVDSGAPESTMQRRGVLVGLMVAYLAATGVLIGQAVYAG